MALLDVVNKHIQDLNYFSITLFLYIYIYRERERERERGCTGQYWDFLDNFDNSECICYLVIFFFFKINEDVKILQYLIFNFERNSNDPLFLYNKSLWFCIYEYINYIYLKKYIQMHEIFYSNKQITRMVIIFLYNVL